MVRIDPAVHAEAARAAASAAKSLAQWTEDVLRAAAKGEASA
ncbi:toxin-antitoxin system HicB family antitoxin [Methylobacterium sp. JK268]